MQEFLESISKWFEGLGVHPVLGAFVLGIVLTAFFLRSQRSTYSGGLSASVGNNPGDFESGFLQRTAVGVENNAISIAINDKTIPLPPDTVAQLTGLMKEKRTVEAIKLLREQTDLTLVDAKRLVETLEKSVFFR